MSAVAYQCPCCGAPLTYGAASGRLECGACANSYETDLLEELNAPQEDAHVQFDMPAQTFSDADREQVHAYICKACGAELMTEETTTATQCPYCGSPTILPDQIADGVRPQMVVPFAISKEEAQKRFEAYFKGKKLLPNVFLNTRNRIAEMRRLYVPYWLFDCSAQGMAVYEAKKRYVRREGNYEVTYTEHYSVSRAGRMSFEKIPVDGSEKLDNRITESLEPYDLSAAVPFQPAVLVGAMADHADVDAALCENRARERVESSFAQALRSTVSGYSSVVERRRSFSADDGRVTPALLPVWLITTEKDGTTYTFAINGQTGKLTCDVPADTGKSFLWGVGVFAGVFAACAAVMYACGMLDEVMLLLAAVLALIAAVSTVAVLTSQLKQAVSAGGAAGYAVDHSFELSVRRDRFLYRTSQRRLIENRQPNR